MIGISRRSFLGAGAAASLGASAARSAILIHLDGGASHVDTFDPKPLVSEFREIPTSVPGIHISEHLPRTARLAHKYTIIRSMCGSETNHERARSVLFRARTAGLVQAARRIERGERIVLASAGRLRWDTHEDNFARLRDELLPEFDLAFSTLLERLDASGLLATTLVVATGEFGRTPRLNAAGGRDHHAAAWSAVVAGAGVPGGRVIGATDRYGAEVTDAPVTLADLGRMIESVLGGGAHEPLFA